MTQFGCHIEVVRDTSTAGFRIQEGQVTLLLAETQGKIGHWVCLQFLYGSHKIQIYDSCCSTNQTTWNKDLRKAVKRLFGNAFSSKLMSSPQQEGDKHCGLFAITNALYIFKGLDLPLRYDQTQMLHHLKMCTKNKFLEPFPGWRPHTVAFTPLAELICIQEARPYWWPNRYYILKTHRLWITLCAAPPLCIASIVVCKLFCRDIKSN